MDEKLLTLRELMINAPSSSATRSVSLAIGLGVLVLVLWLVRTRRLREEYTPIWIAVAIGMLAIGLRLEILRGFANLIGAWTLSSTIFFFGLMGLGAICLHYAVKLSQTGLQIKTLAQELALLRARVDELASDDTSSVGLP